MAWVFREPEHFADAMYAWLGLFLEPALEQGAADVVHDEAGRVLAACARRPPEPVPRGEGAPAVAGLLAALVGHEHAAQVGVHMERTSHTAVPFCEARGASR